MPSGAKLLDDYGEIVARWRAAKDAGVVLPKTWVLERRRFRRALEAALPPGHRISEILSDRSVLRRAAKAARGYERLAAAAEYVSLPEWPAEAEAIVLWSSPVLRPRGVALSGLVQSMTVAPTVEAVREGIGQLWASIYLEPSLRALAARGVKRVEVVVGLTVLGRGESASGDAGSRPSDAESWTALLTEEEHPATGFPWPGGPREPAPPSTLALDLHGAGATAWRSLLRKRFGRAAATLVQQGPGRWQWQAEVALELLERSPPEERAALCWLLGLPLPSDRRKLWKQLGGAPRWAGEGLRKRDLEARVAAHEARCRDAMAGLVELDLAILPDDGLKRTLEDAGELVRSTVELVAECSERAAILVGCAEMLAPGSAPWIDAGLEALPGLDLCAQWEERMSVVRNDGACRTALASAAVTRVGDLPEGPGKRALSTFATSHGFFAADPLEPACPRLGEDPRELLSLARWALEAPVDVLARCRSARFAADRALATVESKQGRWFALSFGALRGLARDVVLLRERVRWIEAHVGALVRRIALDVDRRLRRLEPGLPTGAAFDCTVEELREAVDLTGSSLRARVAWRRAARARQRAHPEPWFSAEQARLTRGTADRTLGLCLSPGRAQGAAIAETLDGLWFLRLAYVPGVLVRWATAADGVVTLGRALGVPIVSTLGRVLPRGSATVISEPEDAAWEVEGPPECGKAAQ